MRILQLVPFFALTLVSYAQDSGIAGTISMLDQPKDSLDSALLGQGWEHGMHTLTNQKDNVKYWMQHYHLGKKKRIMIYNEEGVNTTGIVSEEFQWPLLWFAFNRT